jgi:hypothetical protein
MQTASVLAVHPVVNIAPIIKGRGHVKHADEHATNQYTASYVAGAARGRDHTKQVLIRSAQLAAQPHKQNDDDNCAERVLYICIVGGNHAALISNPPQTEWKMSATPS